MISTTKPAPPSGHWVPRVVSALLMAAGLALGGLGAQLAWLGGSVFYLGAGGVMLVSGGLLLVQRGQAAGAVYGVLLIATSVWAALESEGHFWALFPRLFVPCCLGVLLFWALPFTHTSTHHHRPLGAWPRPLALFLALGALFMLLQTFRPHPEVQALASPRPPSASKLTEAPAVPEDWTHYGRNGLGHRYVPWNQVHAGNVDQLTPVWTFRTGDLATRGAEDQNTPLQIGETLYTCSPHSLVHALDVDTGQLKWRFDPQARAPFWQRCRSLGYADLNQNTIQAPAAPQPSGPCVRRIFLATIDARLMALDADSGERCMAFGQQGTVDLTVGMGEVKPGYYMPTSGPSVIENGLVVLGGWVVDNQSVGEPSGVVRAFDARDGHLVWAWDLGAPQQRGLPEPGQTYTRGTPNVWTTPAFDTQLGLIYLPTGNATPDFWGGGRSAAAEAYSSAVVALDYRSGQERWKFQTTHHDIWDYDLPSQPALVNLPQAQGAPTPALIQLTKRGQIFLLDRRDGRPLAAVEEKPVPQGAAAGDWVSPTQPYSVGMPAIGAQRLEERHMWGMTLFDQLLCRIQFRQLRYEGDFTPPSTQPTL